MDTETLTNHILAAIQDKITVPFRKDDCKSDFLWLMGKLSEMVVGELDHSISNDKWLNIVLPTDEELDYYHIKFFMTIIREQRRLTISYQETRSDWVIVIFQWIDGYDSDAVTLSIDDKDVKLVMSRFWRAAIEKQFNDRIKFP